MSEAKLFVGRVLTYTLTLFDVRAGMVPKREYHKMNFHYYRNLFRKQNA